MTEILVKVQIELSDSTKAFVQGLFSRPESAKPVEATKAVAEKKPTETAKVAADPQPATKAVATESPSTAVSIEELRKLTVSLAETHREEIRAKLKALGATSVSTLDKAKYPEYHKFILSIS